MQLNRTFLQRKDSLKYFTRLQTVVYFRKLYKFFPLQTFSCAAPAKSSGYSRWLKFCIIFKSLRESTAFFGGGRGWRRGEKKAENSNLQPPFFFFFLDSSKLRLSLALPPTSANLKTSASLAAGQGFKSKHYPPAIFQCCLSYPDPPLFFFTPSSRCPPSPSLNSPSLLAVCPALGVPLRSAAANLQGAVRARLRPCPAGRPFPPAAWDGVGWGGMGWDPPAPRTMHSPLSLSAAAAGTNAAFASAAFPFSYLIVRGVLKDQSHPGAAVRAPYGAAPDSLLSLIAHPRSLPLRASSSHLALLLVYQGSVEKPTRLTEVAAR